MEATRGMVPRLLTVRELAATTGLAVWRVYELVANGQAPRYLRIGRTLRFPEPDVLAWIEEQTTNRKQ